MRCLEFLVYSFIWFWGGLLYALPFSLKDRLAAALASFWFHVVRFRRKIILHNLALVFAREPQESMVAFKLRCELLARAHLKHIVLTFFELMERVHWDQATLDRRVQVKGHENLRAFIKTEKGAFFLTAHLGNWELISLVGRLLGVPLVIVAKRQSNPFFNGLLARIRGQNSLEVLPESGSGLGIIRAIRGGKSIGFMLDQHTGEPHGIESEFLGLRAWCPKGLAILTTRLECAVVPAYMIRQPDGRYILNIDPALEFPRLKEASRELRTESGALTEAGLRYHIAICNENMKKWILKTPDQYLWMHRRFKNICDYSKPLPWRL